LREYDESEDIEYKRKRLTPEEREEFLKKHKMMSEQERDEILRTADEESKYPRCWSREILEERIQKYNEFRRMRYRNPCFNEREDVEREIKEIRGYFRIITDKKTNQIPKNLTKKGLADYYEVPVTSVYDWISGKSRPRGLKVLESIERTRIKFEQRHPKESFENFIETSLIYEIFQGFQNPENRNIGFVQDAIQKLDRLILEESKLYIVNLKVYSQRYQTWFQQLSDYIKENRLDIDRKLIESTEKLRIGIIEDSLFIRRIDTNVEHWTEIHSSEHFHFRDSQIKMDLVDDICRRLGGISRRNLGRLMNQFTANQQHGIQSDERYEFRINSSHLRGETLGFILDVRRSTLEDISRDIVRITGLGAKRGRGSIENPRFPKNIEQIKAQLLGAMMSDGHLRPKMSTHYYEKDSTRINRFKEIIGQLGDVQYWEIERTDGHVIGLPAVIGRMLERWGMPTGDKSILNPRLPEVILNGSDEVQLEYLRQLIAEDGSFSFKGGGWRIKWNRAVTLTSNRMKDYGVEPRISDSEIQFLISKGETTETEYNNPYSKRTEPTEKIVMNRGRLDELMKDPDSEIVSAAHRFHRMVMSNISRLLDDELNIPQQFGINVTRRFDNVVLYPETGKVSILWSASTDRNRDAAIWVKLAPPDHARKMDMVHAAIEWGLFERHLPDDMSK
jgi:hypothetical protein